jgi:nodulation protein A
MPLRWSFFPESEMSAGLESEARALLVAAFPMYADFFRTSSFRGSIPEYRLFGRNEAGKLIGHIECGPRVALVANQQVRILGIGSVAVHPANQGQGLGREMFSQLQASANGQQLADFGHLQCREAVAGFYQRAGFERLTQPCVSVHHETGELETHHGPVMALPLLREMTHWPRGGVVDLQGMAW